MTHVIVVGLHVTAKRKCGLYGPVPFSSLFILFPTLPYNKQVFG